METIKILGLLGGLGAIAIGGLMFMAGSMSDAPEEGDAAGAQGCIIAAIGLAVLVASVVGMAR